MIAGETWVVIGRMFYDDPDVLLNNAYSAEVIKNCDACSVPIDTRHSFLPAILYTFGRIHREFLHLLYIFSHRQTEKIFEIFGKRHSNDAFTFRCAKYFLHKR